MDEEVRKLQQQVGPLLEELLQCITKEDLLSLSGVHVQSGVLDAFKQHMQEDIQRTENDLQALIEMKMKMQNESETKSVEKEREQKVKGEMDNDKLKKEMEQLKQQVVQLRMDMEERDAALMEIHKLVSRVKDDDEESGYLSPSAVLSTVRRYIRDCPPRSSSSSDPPPLIYSRSAPSHKAFLSPTFPTLKRSPSSEILEVSKYLKDQRLKGENEAREWIENVAKTPVDSDLMESVRSGRVLCKLVNAIKPGTVKKIHEANTTPIMQMQNITSFLHGCELLGVRKSDLFDATDLFQKKNASGVISTIHALSRASQHVKGFKGPFLTYKMNLDKGRDLPEHI